MPRAFYHDDALYAAEIRTIWQGGWLFAGFEFEIPKPGDFLTLTVDGSPVLVIRDDAGRRARVPQRVPPSRHAAVPQGVRARARDRVPVSQLDVFAAGRSHRLHGHARRRRQVAAAVSSRVHADVTAGLIYVSLAAAPPAFDGLRERFAAAAKPQGFDRARIAKIIDYEVEANWKLVWENNRECFHCVPCHPQYVKANFDVYEEAYASEAIRQKMAAAVARTEAEMGGAGHRDHACEGRPGAVSRSGSQRVVRRGSHGAWSTASTPSRWTAGASRR